MFCSQCGSALAEDETFCHRCGNYVKSVEDPLPNFRIQTSEPSRKLPALIAILLLLSGGVFGAVYYANNNFDAFEADEFVIYGSGAVDKGVISVISDPDDTDPYDGVGMVTLTCNAYSAGGYSWSVRSLSNVTNINDYPMSENVSVSSDGKSLMCTLEPGHYSVKVDTLFKTYEGTFALSGEITRVYNWNYKEYVGGTSITHIFSMDFSFQYKDCISSIEYDGKRGYFFFSKIGSAINEFVLDTNAIIIELEAKLRDEFDKESISVDYPLGSPGNRYNYASYLLSFVQQTVTYASDAIIYGSEEYWAFPAETLVQGHGDCEDSSLLCAALYKVAGYDTAVAVLPGHAMAGVHILGQSVLNTPYPTYPPQDKDKEGSDGKPPYSIYQEIDGKTFYGCEATDGASSLLIGYTTITYTEEVNDEVRSGTLMDWMPGGEYASEDYRYGFYPITA